MVKGRLEEESVSFLEEVTAGGGEIEHDRESASEEDILAKFISKKENFS